MRSTLGTHCHMQGDGWMNNYIYPAARADEDESESE